MKTIDFVSTSACGDFKRDDQLRSWSNNTRALDIKFKLKFLGRALQAGRRAGTAVLHRDVSLLPEMDPQEDRALLGQGGPV